MCLLKQLNLNFRFRFHAVLWVISLLIIAPHIAQAEVAPQSIDTGWQYRWGDSPFNAQGVPEWTLEGNGTGEWAEIAFPSNPPGRDGQSNVWYRVTLPEGGWRNPVIYIYSVDLIVQVYVDGEQIYHYGTFDKDGQGHFEGWPWHMISLAEDFSGKTAYFRVYSSYSDIGLWGEVMLMERLDLIQHIFDNSVEQVVVSGLSFLIALIAIMFAVIQSDRRTFLYISLFTVSSGLMVLGQTQAKQLLFNAPLAWDYMGATAYFVLPVAMALLFGQWCKGKFVRLINWIWRLHAVFVIGAIGISLLGLAELSTMYLYFDGLLSVSLFILFAIAFLQFRAVDFEQKIIIGTFAVFSLFLLIDMGIAHNLLPWTRVPLTRGLMIFSLSMIAISLYRFALTQNALKELNVTLEQKVKDRTHKLELLAANDPLTGSPNRRGFYEKGAHIFLSAKRYNRHVSLIMLDIDHFKQVNDTCGHAVGDQVIIDVAKCCSQICRETDLHARFGGEEFIIMLEEANEENALATAERLREIISKVTVDNSDCNVTASFGVSTLGSKEETLEELIARADKALYAAKDAGRNNCQAG